jgi:DNA-binding transcriptional LysR family regulator
MNRAAAELETVQSNITARIRILEEQLGVKLFLRHSRGVEPSPAALRLLPYAAGINQLLREAHVAIKEDGVPKGTLRLGSMETTAGLRLPATLAAYSQTFPSVDLSIVTGPTLDLVSQVLEHRLDGAFVAGPIHHEHLHEEAMFREELVLVSPRLVEKIEDLRSMVDLKIIVFRQGCSYRRRLERFLLGLDAHYQMIEFASLDAIIACVAAGAGITLLPKAVVRKAWQEGGVAVHELPIAQSQVDTVFIRRVDSHLTSALKEFLVISRRHSPLSAERLTHAAASSEVTS